MKSPCKGPVLKDIWHLSEFQVFVRDGIYENWTWVLQSSHVLGLHTENFPGAWDFLE